ncbi:mechanosensitive ion channel family protein [Rhizobium sp. KVB221]|uniref:Small-conductance mechanosensitive channel n=1 Tax=Rhizobium setariae TaxID=2801340 RepID=A0A936YMF7_9HYPH|nr:mechanosensitive ion channel family protein [Rhizobium setariae]MBL0370901.1 mechanosensitive ion channel family protein [Rhizobium setariae]
MLAYPTFLALVAVNILGVLGIIVWHLQGRQRPTARLIVQILFFAAMTIVLVLSGIIPYRVYGAGVASGGGLLGTSARVLWWVHLAWATIGFVRLYIVLDRRPQEARLFQDLIVAAVYLGVTLSIVGFVFGAPIGTLVATSGVVAIIIGLALQNTLGDLFSGVALTLGRPFSIGDWIQLADGTEGRVVENNWRSTHVLTPAHNIVVLPNSALAKIALTNLTRPDESHLIVLPLRIAAIHRPSIVHEVILTALQTCYCIVQDPAPIVALKSVDAIAIELELQFRVTSPTQRTPARNEVIDVVYGQCAANGIAFAPPVQSLIHWIAGTPGGQTATSGTQSLSGAL